MKKIWKMIAAICLMVAVSAAPVSAAVETEAVVTESAPSSITPGNMSTGSENISSFTNYSVSYTKSNTITVDGSQCYGAIVPVTVAGKGDLCLDFTGVPVISEYMQIGLYTDAACTSRQDAIKYIWDASDADTASFSTSKKGTYYLAFYSTSSSLQTNSITFRSYFYSGENRTLSSGKWAASASGDSSNRYYKVVLKSKGHILVQADQNQSVAICNSSKSLIYDSVYLSTSNGKKASYYLSAGTYYIRTAGVYGDVSRLRYTYYKLGSSKYTLKNKQTITVNPGTSKAYQYIKYKAGVTGYVTLSVPGTDSGYITLCNSSRKALSSEDWIYGNSATSNRQAYGVKKGQTYYIKLRSGYNPFKLALKETSVKEKSGSSKAKAVTVKSGKTVKGTILAGSKTADWYKISVPKRKNVSIVLKGSTNDALKVTVYTKGGKNIGSTRLYDYGYSNTLKSVGKLSKGTYYIKIQRNNSTSSGYYTLKWK